MRCPQEYWIKYLACYEGLSNSDINALLFLNNYLPVDDALISTVRTSAQATKPPARLHTLAARPWLRGQRILSIARQDQAAILAKHWVSDNKLRAVLEALLLAGVSDDDTALHAATLLARPVDKHAVKLFRHYFWNVDLLTIQQWRDYLDEYQGVHGKKLKTFYSKGPVFTLWKLGQRPSIGTDDAINMIFQESAMRFAELTSYPNGQDTALASKMWAENVFKASELLGKTDNAVKRNIEELGQVALRLGRREISSIESLPTEGEGHLVH